MTNIDDPKARLKRFVLQYKTGRHWWRYRGYRTEAARAMALCDLRRTWGAKYEWRTIETSGVPCRRCFGNGAVPPHVAKFLGIPLQREGEWVPCPECTEVAAKCREARA